MSTVLISEVIRASILPCRSETEQVVNGKRSWWLPRSERVAGDWWRRWRNIVNERCFRSTFLELRQPFCGCFEFAGQHDNSLVEALLEKPYLHIHVALIFLQLTNFRFQFAHLDGE